MQPMKQGIQKLGAATLFAIAATQLSGCGATAGIKPSQATGAQFLQQLQAHQYKSAYGLLSSGCKALTTAQQMQNYWELVEKNRGKVQSWSQQGVQFYAGTGGSNVKLGYALKCARGSSSVTLTCVPEKEKWLIQGFYFSG